MTSETLSDGAPNRLPAARGTDELVCFRPACVDDAHFVRNSWLRSNACGVSDTYDVRKKRWTLSDIEAPRNIRHWIYMPEHHRLVSDILARSETIMAHVAGSPDHLVGYVCFEAQDTPVLHYCYVKESFRRLGIGTALLDKFLTFAAGCHAFASHWSWPFERSLLKTHDITFNPYRAHYGKA